MLEEHEQNGHGDGLKWEEHNEVVLDVDHWVANLPSTLQAVFMMPPYVAPAKWSQRNSHEELSLKSDLEHAEAQARGVHADFLRAFNLDASTFPLLRFDRKNRDAPFSCEDCGGARAVA